ncbi:MAG: DUF1643 domain-containing protein [Ignavibacteriae bacterium]|nr:DUF1643 domain-containing protein [Ignavibacteriota bacterium]
MVKFVKASELKKLYSVLGHFYKLKLPNKKVYKCRSVLEIISKPNETKFLTTKNVNKPDSIFIMMNPGSSKPLEELDSIVKTVDIDKMDISLVRAKPDTTQYQVMRVMLVNNWAHVRILNLSDLRNAKSGNFYEEFQEIETNKHGGAHSLFSLRRTNELKLKLNRKVNAPIILAWGVDDSLDPLIMQTKKILNKQNDLHGLLKQGTTDKYYHPLPAIQHQKEKWVNDIISSLKE